MPKKAQAVQIGGIVSIFIFAILATALLPTVADLVESAQTADNDVYNENKTITNDTAEQTFVMNNTPLASIIEMTNGSGVAISVSATDITCGGSTPCYVINSAALSNISVNLSYSTTTATQGIEVDYSYAGSSNLSNTDDTLLSLWPTFIVIGGLIAILGAFGLRG